MRRGRVALFSALGILAVVAIFLIVVLTTDLGRIKGLTETLVSDALGRNFEIRGTFKLELGRTSLLIAEDVHLSGAAWSANEDLASVARLETTIDTLSLIGGPIKIESLTIDGARIHLEKSPGGQNNWTFDSEAGADSDAPGPGLEKLPLMVWILGVRDFQLSYSDPAMNQALVITIDKLDEAIGEQGDVQANAAGSVNSTPFSLSAAITDVSSLIALQDVSSTLRGELGEIRFSGAAVFDHLFAPKRPTLELQLRGPNAEYLTDILGFERITTGPLTLDAAVSPGDPNMNLSVLGTFGEFSIDANGYVGDLGNFDEMYVHASASGPNAGTIGKLVGNYAVPEDPFQLEVDARISGTSIQLNPLRLEIGVTKLDASASIANFPSPDGASAKMQVNGPDFGKFNKLFGLPGKLTGPFSLDAGVNALPDKKAKVSLHAKAHDLSLTLDGIWVDAPGFAGTTLDIGASGPRFDTIMKTLGVEQSPSDGFELQLSLEKSASASRISSGRFKIGVDQLKITGQVGDKPLRNDTDLEFEIIGPNFRKTLKSFGATADRLPATAWSARGGVKWDNGQLVLEQIRTVIGSNREYRLDVESRITEDPSLIGSTAKVSFAGAEFGAVAEVGGILELPNARFHVTGDIERVANGFSIRDGNIQLGSDSIRIDGLVGEIPLRQGTDVTVDVSIVDFRETLESFGLPVDSAPPGPLTASGRLLSQGDVFVVRNVSADTSGAKMTATGHLGAFPKLIGTEVDLNITGKDLSQLLPAKQSFKATTDSFALKSKIRIAADGVSLEGLDATFDQAKLKGRATASLDPFLQKGSFAVQADTPDFGSFLQRYSGRVSRSGVPMSLATSGNWDQNFWHFDDFLFTLAEGRLAIKGSLDGPPNFDRTDLTIDLHVANVRNLSSLVGRDLPQESADLHSHLTGTTDQMTLQEFDAKFGDSDIDGEFSLQGGDIPRADVKMVSRHLDLSAYQPPQQVAPKKAASAPKDKILPTTPLELNLLRKFNATVDVKVNNLVLRQRVIKNIVLVATLDEGDMSVSEFNLEGARGGTLSGALLLKQDESRADLTVNLTGRKLDLGLPAESSKDLENLPQYDVDAMLTGSGSSIAELAGSSNGFVRVVAGSGQVKASAMRMFTQDFLSQILNTVNPFAKTEPYTQLKCAAILIKATNGTIEGQPALVVQTDKLNIFANANVDLKSEKIDVALNTVPQTGLGISLSDLVTPYTKVGGTLANPTLALDAEGAILQGGAAVATAGISFLAMRFKDRYLSAKDACGKAVDDTNEEFENLQNQN